MVMEKAKKATATQKAAEVTANGQIIGPADPAELLGCQDGVQRVTNFISEHIVLPENGLNMRMDPNSDADIAAVLPCGSGVTATGLVKGPWMEVVTGRLAGWVRRDLVAAVVPNSAVYG